MTSLPSVSLFSGAGGLDAGLEQAGFRFLAAVETDPVRVETLKSNMPHVRVMQQDVRRLSAAELLDTAGACRGELALVAGGPPCQPFSKAALWRGRREADLRANLVLEFARVVSELSPFAFILENVPGLAGKLGRGIFDQFIAVISKSYRVVYDIMDAAEYGVPQRRKRLIAVGIRRDLGVCPDLPKPTHGPRADTTFVTAGEAIGDLDDGCVKRDEVPQGKWGHLLSRIPPGMNYIWLTEKHSSRPIFRYRSRYWSFLLKLHPELPSWTIPARPGPYTGPFHWRSRRLRIPEVKRLQSFPDSWTLAGSTREQWQQLGDATPPLLARRLGESLMIALKEAL